MNYPFLNTNFALKPQGKCWKVDVRTFTAHLSVTIKRLTRSKQKVVLAAILGLQHGGQYKWYYFVEKSKCHKISPLNAFPLKFSGGRLFEVFALGSLVVHMIIIYNYQVYAWQTHAQDVFWDLHHIKIFKYGQPVKCEKMTSATFEL